MANDNDYRKKAVEIIGNCVCKERNEAYGSVEQNFGNIGELWTWWLKKRGILTDDQQAIGVLDVAQMIAMIKTSRKLNDIEYLDNWIDEAGYNACGAAEVLRSQHTALEKQQQLRVPAGGGCTCPVCLAERKRTRLDAQRKQEHAAESREDSEAAGRDAR